VAVTHYEINYKTVENTAVKSPQIPRLAFSAKNPWRLAGGFEQLTDILAGLKKTFTTLRLMGTTE